MSHLKILALEIRKKDIALAVFITSTIYLLTSLLVLNFNMFSSFLTTSLPSSTKITILPHIVLTSFTQMPVWMQVLHITIALLFALNLVLAWKKFRATTKSKNLKLNFGAGLVSIGTAGCVSCGFSVLSILGLGGAAAALPFGGDEILFAVAALLTLTLIYNIHSFTKICKIKSHV